MGALLAGMLTPLTWLAEADPPAGGAATGEVIIATAMGLVATAFVLGPIAAYRAGRFPALGRLAESAARASRMPAMAALPIAVLGGALLIAVFGMYWDISLHIDNGRDPGPLANPAHHFILVGLLGVMAAGVLAMALPTRPTRSSVHIPGVDWDAPVGGIMIAACGAFSLTAFPLDDVWHRLFGQDVTLWSPTHLMLITGASLSVLGGLALYREAIEDSGELDLAPLARLSMYQLAGAFLIGLNTFMAEFDFGVPQFRLDFHPIGLMMAAGVALVSARLVIGPGGALGAAVFFLVLRGLLTLIVGPVLGQTEPHFPLYIVEALCVEAVALAFARRSRPIASTPATFGAVAGVAIGTIGLASEWAWAQGWIVNEWPSSLFPQAALLAFAMAVAAGALGGFVGRALTPGGTKLAPAPYWALPLAAAVGVAVTLYTLPIATGDRTTATFELTEVGTGPDRTVDAVVTLDPPDAAEDARWLQVTSWQGEEKSIVALLEEVDQDGPGVYRSTEPIPVSGTWKSILRLHVDDRVLGMPVFLPEDTGIPADEVPPPAPGEAVAFVKDKEILQREQKEDVSDVLTKGSYFAVLAITIMLFGVLFWGLRRIRVSIGRDEEPPPADAEPVRPSRPSPGAPRPAV